MTATARCVLFGLLAILLAEQSQAQAAYPMGRHRMALITPGGDLPFGMSLEGDGKGNLEVFIINGDERIQVPEVTDTKQLVLRFPHYDSELRLNLDQGNPRITGEWIKRRGKGKETRMRVESRRLGQRFDILKKAGDAVRWPVGNYRVAFGKSKDPAVGQFAITTDATANCRGTFLTTLGDYRFLAGNSNGQVMRLSCFDGAHAFLFHADRQKDDSLKGDFWSSDSWHEPWTATADAKAELPDGWNLTKWRKGADLGRGKYRDLEGKSRSLMEPPYAGKPRIIEVFGSWCPNCHDHGEYMAELHRRYADKGLQVIGLAFEHDEDFARSVRQVKTFVKRHGATFPILIAGLSNKSKASESLGLVDKVRSFPTTIFVDKNDKVRGIYQGWSGPATGDVHTRLRQRFEALIETMLRE
ncbi:MAG: thiol-disulfide isomerase/thioredoxin [Planctomycetota bacterium]|jgi:thiol-disulfide isomerase/thioredoxin